MVRVASYGKPYPAITGSVIPESAWNKEPYLHKTYEGKFELQYSPRMPTPREAVVALSYAIDKFEADHPGVKTIYAVIDHPSELERLQGSVPTCTFQFVTEHHSPFLLELLILGIAAAIAAGIAYGTAFLVSVLAAVLLLTFLIGVLDAVVQAVRGPTLKCPKCDYDCDYEGVACLEAHWRAAHSDQEEPDWAAIEKAYSASQVGTYIMWGLIGIGGVIGLYAVFKIISRPRKEKPKKEEKAPEEKAK
jgi:hypothetical protein